MGLPQGIDTNDQHDKSEDNVDEHFGRDPWHVWRHFLVGEAEMGFHVLGDEEAALGAGLGED